MRHTFSLRRRDCEEKLELFGKLTSGFRSSNRRARCLQASLFGNRQMSAFASRLLVTDAETTGLFGNPIPGSAVKQVGHQW